MEGKPKYPDGEALDRAVAEAMNDAAAGRATRRSRPPRDVTLPPASITELFTGQRSEDPRVIRRAKARDTFYRRFTALLLVAMICATILASVWMIFR